MNEKNKKHNIIKCPLPKIIYSLANCPNETKNSEINFKPKELKRKRLYNRSPNNLPSLKNEASPVKAMSSQNCKHKPYIHNKIKLNNNKENKKQNSKEILQKLDMNTYYEKILDIGYNNQNIGNINRKALNEIIKNIKLSEKNKKKIEKLYEHLREINKSFQDSKKNDNKNNNQMKIEPNINNIDVKYVMLSFKRNENDLGNKTMQGLSYNKFRYSKEYHKPKTTNDEKHNYDISRIKTKLRINKLSGNRIIRYKNRSQSKLINNKNNNFEPPKPKNIIKAGKNVFIKDFFKDLANITNNNRRTLTNLSVYINNFKSNTNLNNIESFQNSQNNNGLSNTCNENNFSRNLIQENPKQILSKNIININKNPKSNICDENEINHNNIQKNFNNKFKKNGDMSHTVRDKTNNMKIGNFISQNKNIILDNQNLKMSEVKKDTNKRKINLGTKENFLQNIKLELPNKNKSSKNINQDNNKNKNKNDMKYKKNDQSLKENFSNSLHIKKDISELKPIDNKNSEQIINQNEINNFKEIEKPKKLGENKDKVIINEMKQGYKNINIQKKEIENNQNNDNISIPKNENIIENKDKDEEKFISEQVKEEKKEQDPLNQFHDIIYESLNLNRSFSDNRTEDIFSFDLEYICHSLSLSLLILIEISKESPHLTQIDLESLYSSRLNFFFFNDTYNTNINLLFDLFDKDINNKAKYMSPLDRLESIIQQNDDEINYNINFLRHMKKEGDEKIIKLDEEKEKTYVKNAFKIRPGIFGVNKNSHFIDEFFGINFKNRKKIRNYQHISEISKNILCKELSYINEIDSELNLTNTKSNDNNSVSNNNTQNKLNNENEDIKTDDREEINLNIENDNNIESIQNENKDTNLDNIKDNIKDSPIGKNAPNLKQEKIEDKNEEQNKVDDINNEKEQINKNEEEAIKINMENENDLYEYDYIIDINSIEELTFYIVKRSEIFDEDFSFVLMRLAEKRYIPTPDPKSIFDFIADVLIITKMEKEVIILALIYIERFIFNTGLLLTSRNWRRIVLISMIVASKFYDDNSFENIHFSQVFANLGVNEINTLERIFLEFINYKTFVTQSQYFQYLMILKENAMRFGYNGKEPIITSMVKNIKFQEFKEAIQNRMRRKVTLNNSAMF